jgi:hypothetical protein
MQGEPASLSLSQLSGCQKSNLFSSDGKLVPHITYHTRRYKMNSAAFGEYTLISVVSWFVGVVLGGGLGYACALVARRILTASASSGRYVVLLPWRTIVITLPLFSPFIPVAVGLGVSAGIAIAGLGVFVLALVFTITNLLEYWFLPSLTSRLVIGARSIAVASPIIAVGASFLGGGAIGSLIWQGGPRPDYLALSMVILLALVFDVLLGIVQMVLSRFGHISPEVQGA